MSRRGCARVQSFRRRGKQVLVWLAGSFFFVQFLGGLLLDFCFPQVRFPSAEAMFARLSALDRSPEIVVLGSSRFQGALISTHIDGLLARRFVPAPRSFNASLPAGDPIVAEWVVERLLAKGHKPGLLVLEISPETISQRANWLEYHVHRQLTWLDIPAYLPEIIRHTHQLRFLASRFLPLFTHRYELRKRARDLVLAAWTDPKDNPAFLAPIPEQTVRSQAPPIEQDFVVTTAEDGDMTDLEGPPVAASPPDMSGLADMQRWMRGFQIGGPETRALERLLGSCRQQGIHVLLVAVPVSQPHRAFYTPEVDRSFLAYMEQLRSRFGCPFVDWRDRIPDGCFADNHHIAAECREYVSRLLTAHVLVPAWREALKANP